MKKWENKVIYKNLSYQIVGVLFEVYNELGFGYKEKYYEAAVAHDFELKNIKFSRQVPYLVKYKDKIIGRNYLDFLVEDKIILELKKGDYFSQKNIEQIKQYLQITGLQLAILGHFTSSGVKTFRAFNPKNIRK